MVEVVLFMEISEELNHIRFNRLVLFVEKILTIVLVLLAVLAGPEYKLLFVVAVVVILVYWTLSKQQAQLENSIGLPAPRLVIKF